MTAVFGLNIFVFFAFHARVRTLSLEKCFVADAIYFISFRFVFIWFVFAIHPFDAALRSLHISTTMPKRKYIYKISRVEKIQQQKNE